MIQRILRSTAIKAVVVMVLGAVVAVYVLAQRNRDLTLPVPLGTYPVGRRITTWTDPSRRENLGDPVGGHRSLSAWIWYPAEQNGSRVPYMPTDWARARTAGRGIGSQMFQSIDSINGHATDARPALQDGPFPVLVFEPGLGPLIPEYTSLAEDLASRGYVVIGLNPTYSASITVVGDRTVTRSAARRVQPGYASSRRTR